MLNARQTIVTRCILQACLGILAVAASAPAQAGMMLSKVILDLQPGKPSFEDIEVWNDGAERMYVLAETAEIIAPGTPQQRREPRPDPTVSGLLVAPQRLVLDPGQRRTVRVSAVAERPATDRVFRIAIKPVAGPLSAEVSALKVLVGYDVLVLYRPANVNGDLTAERAGRRLTIRNDSNAALELFDGKQCAPSGTDCRKLAATRLYAGGRLEQDLPFDTPVDYQVSNGRRTTSRRF